MFELGSLTHSNYLLNLRLPATFDTANDGEIGLKHNDLGKLVDVHLVAIHQNGGFTKVKKYCESKFQGRRKQQQK